MRRFCQAMVGVLLVCGCRNEIKNACGNGFGSAPVLIFNEDNTHYFNRTAAAGYLEYGGGRPRLMAASDALMGAIPDVFPFGCQYGWTGRGNETYLYRIRFEDPEVQLALKAAKPVADLHRRIGKLEMTDFELLSEDGCLQRTTFADGTRVTANFSNFLRSDGGIVPLGAESWQADRI